MIETISVSSRGQIVIPERIRKKYKLIEGSRLILIEQGEKIILEEENTFTKKLALSDTKEEVGWLALAEKSLHDIWDNEKDEQTWKEYL